MVFYLGEIFGLGGTKSLVNSRQLCKGSLEIWCSV